MNVKNIEKVTNGWVAYDEFGAAVAVATTQEQLADMLGIIINSTPAYTPKSVFLTLNHNFNPAQFFRDVNAGRKIDAIKAFRNAFVSEDHSRVTVGLKESKDFVEALMSYMVYMEISLKHS